MARQITRWEDCRGKLHKTETEALISERTYMMEEAAERFIDSMDEDSGAGISSYSRDDLAKWLIGSGAERLIAFAALVAEYQETVQP